MDPAKVSAIVETVVPPNTTELRSLLGLAVYYSCFIGTEQISQPH